jgi:hypothetical protein
MSSVRVTDSGIPGVGKVSWGKHICQLYRSKTDLIQSIIPFLVAGLRNNERCMFGAGMPLYADELKKELAKAHPRFQQCLDKGQITVFDHHEWYVDNKSSDPVKDLLETEKQALADGYRGLRCGGNISWITRKDWGPFCEYEHRVNSALKGRRLLAICSYDITRCEGSEVFDAIRSHHYTIARQPEEDWDLYETSLLA